MARKWYEITLKPLQPLHIGSGNYGVVNPTRIFIPGWTIWGALTAAFGIKNGWDKNELKNEQKELFEQVSNFYPLINGNILFPNYKKGEFCLGEYTEKKFRHLATDTFTSTAINALDQSANKNSLHEIEYLLPKTKESKPKDILWKGILNIDNEDNYYNLKSFISAGTELSIGGERSKGFGKVIIYNVKKLEEKEKWNIQDENISLDREPSVHFVSTDDDNKSISKGEIIPYVEILSSDKNSLELSKIKMIYKPGVRAEHKNQKTLILKKGIVNLFTYLQCMMSAKKE